MRFKNKKVTEPCIFTGERPDPIGERPDFTGKRF